MANASQEWFDFTVSTGEWVLAHHDLVKLIGILLIGALTLLSILVAVLISFSAGSRAKVGKEHYPRGASVHAGAGAATENASGQREEQRHE